MILWDKEGNYYESITAVVLRDKTPKKKTMKLKHTKYILGILLLLVAGYFLRYYIAYILLLIILGIVSVL